MSKTATHAEKTAAELSLKSALPQPCKIQVANHPQVCNCRLCSLDYCDCSEEQQGTVGHTDEYWKSK